MNCIHHRIVYLLLSCFLGTSLLQAQPDTLRVLFLGNSYTSYNNLPNLVQLLGDAQGKTVLVDSHTPGGHTYQLHHQNATSLQKIRQGNWDAVVLQEQSQIPTIPYYRDGEMFPFARLLADSIRLYNPCAQLCYYQTWGRRYGGQQCGGGYCSPAFVDFDHMQDSLTAAYHQVAQQTKGLVLPVGESWRHALGNYSVALFTADNSHPNLAGSYLAASTILGRLFDLRTVPNSYTGGLAPATSLNLRRSADSVVWGRAAEWQEPPLRCAFNPIQITTNSYQCINVSNVRVGAQHQWTFSDGGSSTDVHPTHSFTGSLPYTATLISSYCGETDTLTKVLAGLPLAVTAVETEQIAVKLYPNPTTKETTLSIPSSWSGQLTVYNSLLQPVHRQIITTPYTQLNIADLPKGCYTLVLRNDRDQLVWRDLLIKQ